MRRLSVLRKPSTFLSAALALAAAGATVLLAACAPANSGAVLGDRVWRDTNSNGLQDAGEPGAAGVTVSLHREDGGLVASTTTDDLGAYDIAAPASGRYFLTFSAPQANLFTLKDAGDDAADSDIDPLSGQTDAFDFVSGQPDLTLDAGLIEVEPTPTPPPPATPTPEPEPVVPPTGGKYRMRITFVWVSGECGLPKEFVDTIDFDLSAADPTTGSHATTLNQPSTGDINTGQTLPNGEGQASSERESYSYTLEFVLDETGNGVLTIHTGVYTYTDTNGCVTVYEIAGFGQIVGE